MLVFDEKKPDIPRDLEAEASLIAAIISNNAVFDEIGGMVTSDMFYSVPHQRMYSAVCEMASDNMRIDQITLKNHLSQTGQLDMSGGPAYIPKLMKFCGDPKLAKDYAHSIRGKAALRRLMADSVEVYKACQAGRKPEDVITDAQNRVGSISLDCGVDECTLSEMQPEAVDRYERAVNMTGIPAGYLKFDMMTGGLQDGDYIILAARPSQGKTSLAINIAMNAASIGAIPCIFSLEMTRRQLIDRINAVKSGVPTNRLKQGLQPGDAERIHDAMRRMDGWKFVIDDNSGLHFNEIARRARRYKRKHGANLFIVDYLQLVHGDNPGDRTAEIGTVSRAMKRIAKDLDAPLLALSQLNRKIEDRNDKRPRLADLRRSGSLEQDADIVAFIYRDEVYHEDTDQPGIAEIMIKKHRNGPTGMFEAAWIPETTKFEDIIPGWGKR